MDIFEKASREKLRFSTSQGQFSVEDLWNLPLTSPSGRSVNLYDIANGLNKELKESKDDLFSDAPASKGTTLTQLRFDIAKHVIETKRKEREEAQATEKRKAEKQRILELLAKKKDAALEAKSEEELQKLLAEMDK